MTQSFTWTDNPMISGVSTCDTDIVNDDLMYLKSKSDTNTSNISTLQTTTGTLTTDVGMLQTTTGTLQTTVTNKADKSPAINVLATSGTINLSDNTINRITPSGTVTFSLPAISDHTKFHQIMVQINLNSNYSINLGCTYFFNKVTPSMAEVGTYVLLYEHNGSNWVCGSMVTGEDL